MCEANVYMLGKDGKQKLILESVDKVIPSGDEILLENIFSQRKIVKAKIKEMELVEHKIVLEEND
jgi:predicted RNA-binding protein